LSQSLKCWEITRGDNFQLEITAAEDSLLAAIRIKALLRTTKGLDVRMAISIGKKLRCCEDFRIKWACIYQFGAEI
jgi:hypothetical protein